MSPARIAVIGAGTMGRGIALTAVRHGCAVAVFDPDPAAAQRASDAAAGLAGEPVTVAESIDAAVRHADAVIEAVVELEEPKADVLRAIASAAPGDALLATNTSTMSIGRLAALSGTGGRLVGMHFFNPPQKMRLVEVVVADGTPSGLVRRCTELAEALGKTPVVVRDSPGFITSRLGLILGNEAMRLVAEGVADPLAIDTAMRLGYNHPMGPLELADLVGLDARLNNLNSLSAALDDERYRPPRILADMVRAGHLGRKSGRGFYRYDADGRTIDGPA